MGLAVLFAASPRFQGFLNPAGEPRGEAGARLPSHLTQPGREMKTLPGTPSPAPPATPRTSYTSWGAGGGGSTHTRGRTEPAADGTPRQVPPGAGGGRGAENAPLTTPMSPWGFSTAGAIPEPSGGGDRIPTRRRPARGDGGHTGMLRGRAPHRAPPPPGGDRSPDRRPAPGEGRGGGGGRTDCGGSAHPAHPPGSTTPGPATGSGPAPSPAPGTRPPGRSRRRPLPLRRLPRSPEPGTGALPTVTLPPRCHPPPPCHTPPPRAGATGRRRRPHRLVASPGGRCPSPLAALYTGAGRGLAAAPRVARDFPPAPAPPRPAPGPAGLCVSSSPPPAPPSPSPVPGGRAVPAGSGTYRDPPVTGCGDPPSQGMQGTPSVRAAGTPHQGVQGPPSKGMQGPPPPSWGCRNVGIRG